MRSGIWNHQRRSDDPRCREPLHIPIREPGRCDDDREENFLIETDGVDVFEVEPRGKPEEDGYEENDGDSDDEEEGDNLKPSLEPDRLPNPLISNSNDAVTEVGNGAMQRANRLRGGAEAELNNKPYAVKFRGGKAGAVYTDQDCVDGNAAYTSQIGNPDNPFSPFSSQVEWEIAHWAKTRGPSSTAFTELMSIKGVSGITLRTQLGSHLICNQGP